MQVLILGAGAVGGYFGSKLLTAGADVTFLVHEASRARLSGNGLVVTDASGTTKHQVDAVVDLAPDFAPDVVILACKAPALAGAMDAVAPAVQDGTRLLPLLNGVAHIELLQHRFPQANLLAGLVHGALDQRDDGSIALLSPFFSASLGALSETTDSVADELVAHLASAGADAKASTDILQDMWSKFVFLTTLAGITCLMRASVGTILASEGGPDLVEQLFRECVAVAEAEGFPPDETALCDYRRPLFERGSPLTSSMLRDVYRNRPTEAAHIVGDMLRRAGLRRIDTPVLRIANAHLQCYEATISPTA
jgi:2-dehydropantoate 2-reductase